MADKSKIEWTDATWNPVTGCSVVSPGCTNCYAMKLAGARLKNHPSREGLTTMTRAGPVWTGEVRINEQWIDQPLRWKRPREIFVCAHGDLFHEAVPDEVIDRIFAIMALCPQHIFQVLTKRSARMRAYLTRPAGNGRPDILNTLAWDATTQVMKSWYPAWGKEGIDGPHRSRAIHAFSTWPLPNVWLGVSVEDQTRADERIPDLLATPAAIRFISAEPLLGLVDLTDLTISDDRPGEQHMSALYCEELLEEVESEPWRNNTLDWVIVGGEAGSGARPMHPDWARSIRDQCAAYGVPFFFKQWGNWLPAGQLMADGRPWAPVTGNTLHAVKSMTGRFLDGVEHNAMPGPGR